MPIDALRSVSDHFDAILRYVSPKRIASEMAKADKAFYFRHFKGYRPEKIGRGRIRKIAQREIFADPPNELFANLIIIHWNEAHAKLYEEMVTHVKTINEDVEAIEKIEDAKAHVIIDDLLQRFERVAILLCVRLNGVRFDGELIASRLVRGEAAPATADAVAAPEDAAGDEAPVAETDAGDDASDDAGAPGTPA